MITESTIKPRLIWIDDEIDERLIQPFKKYFDIKLFRSPNKALNAIKANTFAHYDIIVTDLKMPKLNGIQLYDSFPESIKEITLFCSANLYNDPFEEQLIERRIKNNRTFDCDHLGDPDTRESVAKKIYEQFEKQNINKISYNEYLSFSFEKKERILEYVVSKNKKVIEKYFKQTKSSWIIFQDGKILTSGQLNNEPCTQDLHEISSLSEKPSFLIHRNIIVESIINDLNNETYFREVSIIDQIEIPEYPTITLQIENHTEKKQLLADFDTGAYTNFLREDLLEQLIDKKEFKQYITLRQPRLMPLNGQYTNVSSWTLSFRFNKENELKKIRFNIIRDWENSFVGKHYKNRQALIGRNFLIKQKVKVLLNGENKTTKIL